MRIIRLSALTALAFTAGLLSRAEATLVPGKANNCTAVWDTGTATATPGANPNKPYAVTCSEGDPSCDSDGVQDGICRIVLNACIGQTTDTCTTPADIEGTLKFSGQVQRGVVGGFVPPDPAAAPTCGTAGTLALPLKRVPKNVNKPLKRFNASKKANLVMKAKRFQNKLVVQCTPPGGTGSCPLRAEDPTFPAQVTLTVPETGSDLDNGWTGSSHNFPVIFGSSLRYCLSNCDGTSDRICDGSGQTGDGSLNGPTFGAPLPLLAANVPVCVINRFQEPVITNIYDLASGQGQGNVNLFSDVYLTNNPTEVCPRCNVTGAGATLERSLLNRPGRCSDTARAAGQDCRVEGLVRVAQGAGNQNYLLSGACIPTQGLLTATLDIRLPLTTGTVSRQGPLPCPDSAGPQTQDDQCGGGQCNAGCTGVACATTDAQGRCIDSKGGISQLCCSNNTAIPCFPTRGGGTIERTGTPIPPDGTGAFAAFFCIARTSSALINTVTGLPGPGALILPAESVVTP
jgi:hypothetical protein